MPWTKVYLGERELGMTPLVELTLPPGRHTLQLINEEQGINRAVEVEVLAGRTTAKTLKF